MPSLRESAIELSPSRYRRLPSEPAPFQPNPAPALPIGVQRATVMISSLPPIATDVDGVLRQFYGGRNLPFRRLSLP